MLGLLPHRAVVAADFEFEFGGHAIPEDAGRSGERPRPVCMVAKELRTGQEWRMGRGEFGPEPPFPFGPDALFIAYYASAELGCFRALGWPKPVNILDLFVEFRDRTNGLETPAGAGLIASALLAMLSAVIHKGWRRFSLGLMGASILLFLALLIFAKFA